MTAELPTGPGSNPLTKKIGPLPGIAYVIIAVGVVLAVKWYRNRQSPAVPALSVDPSATGAAPGTGSATGLTGGGTGIVTTANGNPSPSTNAQWASMAVSGLIAKGLDPATVTNALNAYVNGKTLTAQQQAIVSQALVTYGNPPEGLLPVQSAPPTAPAPTPSPTPTAGAQLHYYHIQPGDTWNSISEHFYGTPNEAWRLAAANPAVAKHFQRNERIVIPVPLSKNQYSIMPGDTWQSVSVRFYGNASHVPALKAANPHVIFQRGQTLVIP